MSCSLALPININTTTTIGHFICFSEISKNKTLVVWRVEVESHIKCLSRQGVVRWIVVPAPGVGSTAFYGP
jgi:hypothetical protein